MDSLFFPPFRAGVMKKTAKISLHFLFKKKASTPLSPTLLYEFLLYKIAKFALI